MRKPITELLQNIIAENTNPQNWWGSLVASVLVQSQAYHSEQRFDIDSDTSAEDILKHFFSQHPYELRIIRANRDSVKSNLYAFGSPEGQAHTFTYIDIDIGTTSGVSKYADIRVLSNSKDIAIVSTELK